MAIPYWRTQDIGWTGISFPFRLDSRGRIATSTVDVETGDLQHVREAIEQLVRTPVGSRFFNRKFGASPVDIVFRLNDPNHLALALSELQDTLRRWEPRVILRGWKIVDSDPEQGWVRIRLDFEYWQGQVVDSVEVPYG